MKKIFIFLLIAITIPTILFANEQIASPENKFILEIALWHSLTGEKIKHEIEVSEESKFDITTTVENTKWNLSGTIGKLIDKEIPIKIHTEWYKTEETNEKSDTELKLKLGKESSSGAVHGIIITVLIRENKTR